MLRANEGCAPAGIVIPLLFAVCLIAGRLSGEPIPSPELKSIFPMGAKAGSDVELVITGEAIEGRQSLVFSHPGIVATPVMSQPDRFYPEARPVPDHFKVHVAPDVPAGRYEVRFASRLGLSAARTFFVGSDPETVVRQAASEWEKAPGVQPNSVVNDACEPQVSHLFRFTAHKGDRLTLHCYARGADSRLDAVLTLLDAAGNPLKQSHDPLRLDPTLYLTVPDDGIYGVSVHDYLYAGGPEYTYRLAISTRPWVESVEPRVVSAGRPAALTLFGWNLPGGTPAGTAAPDGTPLEKLQITATLPAASDAAAVGLDPVSASINWANVPLPSGAQSAGEVRVAVVEGELQADSPQSLSEDHPSPLGPSAQILGHFERDKDRHWFSFLAKKGQRIWFEVISRRLGAPTDPELLVQELVKGEQGKVEPRDVVDVDDIEQQGDPGDRRTELRNSDPGLLFTAPEDGNYRLLVHDLNGGSSAGLPYLLIARPPKPGFSLLAYPARLDPEDGRSFPIAGRLHRGGSSAIEVLVFRHEGFEGEIRVSAASLPTGVTAAEALLGPGVSLASVVIQAATDAPLWSGPIEIRGTADAGEAQVSRSAQPLEVINRPPEGVERAPMRVVSRVELAVTDDLKPPMAVVLGDGQPIRTSRGGKVQVPLRVTRTAAAKGEVQVRLHGLPERIRTDETSLAAGESQKSLTLDIDPEAKPGTYSFMVRASVLTPYIRSPEVLEQAEQDHKRIDALHASLTKAFGDAQQARQRAEQANQEAKQKANQAEQQRVQMEQASRSADAAAKDAAEQVESRTRALADAPQPEQANRKAALDEAQKRLTDLSAKAKAAQEALATAVAMKADTETKAAAAEQAQKDAVAAEMKAKQDAEQAEEARRVGEERARQAHDLSSERDLRVVVPTQPVTLRVLANPFVLTAPPTLAVQASPETPAELPVSIAPDLGFAGEIRFEARSLDGTSGISFVDPGNQIAAGQTKATLKLRVETGTPAGAHPYELHLHYHFGDRDLEAEQPIQFQVSPKPGK